MLILSHPLRMNTSSSEAEVSYQVFSRKNITQNILCCKDSSEFGIKPTMWLVDDHIDRIKILLGTCVQCLSKCKQKHIIRKIYQSQLDNSSSEHQNIQTNMPSDIENQTDNIKYNREIHIDQLSQLVGKLTDENNNLSEFELNITFNVRDENNSISQITKKIRDEFAEGDGYKWK